MTDKIHNCWVCGGSTWKLFKKSDVTQGLNSNNFAITNFDYGKTGELQRCVNCDFIQCIDLKNVVGFYEDLEDPGYEDTRKERKLQEQRLMKILAKYKPTGKLLDIGAGSGIMVESALEMGYSAVGIEPSKWLQQKAVERNLPIFQGIFPHPQTPGPFDVITFVDVIEHVTFPGKLLTEINQTLNDNGIFVVVTPDVNSLAARLLKFKWWHFRVAHIGYFNQKNLHLLLEKSGFEIIRTLRPSWYFTVKYLGVRFQSFMPKFLRFPLPRFLDKITVPVNLRDSLLVICKKKV